jgi:hypothetical protein
MATQPAIVQVRGARSQARVRLVSLVPCAFAGSLTLNCQYRDA